MSGFKSYFPVGGLTVGQSVTLDRPESHHLVRVLRARSGDAVALFDGKGRVWQSRLTDLNGKAAVVQVESAECRERPLPEVTLIQAVPKGKTMDQVVRQATEMGVARVFPLISEHSEVKLEGERASSKREHWQAIAVEACKQSGNCFLPEIAPLQSFKAWAERCEAEAAFADSLNFVASLQADARPLPHWRTSVADCRTASWAIGPEGDFSEKEYATFRALGFKPVSLAQQVLRVDTATLYALSIGDCFLRSGQA